jgi:hypothetical protein
MLRLFPAAPWTQRPLEKHSDRDDERQRYHDNASASMMPTLGQPHDQATPSHATGGDRADAASRTSIVLTAPAGAFTASVLLDVLSLVAASPEEADRDERRAADLLRLGVGAALGSVTLELADALRAPLDAAPATTLRTLTTNGLVVAVYLFAIAERQKQVNAGKARAGAAPLGLSLLGLALLAFAGKLS